MRLLLFVILIFCFYKFGVAQNNLPLSCWVGFYFNDTMRGSSMPCEEGTCVYFNGIYYNQQVNIFSCEPSGSCDNEISIVGMNYSCCNNSNYCNANGFPLPIQPDPTPSTGKPIICNEGIFQNNLALSSPAYKICYGECFSFSLLYTNITITISTCSQQTFCKTLNLENSCGTLPQAILAGCCCDTDLCIDPATNTFPSSTMASTTTTTPGIPYIPCKSWISFSIDDSNNLDSNAFKNQLQFIVSAIGTINYPERIQAVGMFDSPSDWNDGLTIQQIQDSVYSIEQGGHYSLREQFANIVTSLDVLQNFTVPIGAIIFISDTSDAALAGAEQFTSRLTDISLTFVLLGSNVDSSKLTKFSSNFIYWPNLNQLQPDNWENLSYAAYGCSSNITPTPSSQCVDTSSDCSQTMNDCKNALYKPLLCKYCQKSCNLCDDPACATAK